MLDWKVIVALFFVCIVVYALVKEPGMLHHVLGWLDNVFSGKVSIGGK